MWCTHPSHNENLLWRHDVQQQHVVKTSPTPNICCGHTTYTTACCLIYTYQIYVTTTLFCVFRVSTTHMCCDICNTTTLCCWLNVPTTNICCWFTTFCVGTHVFTTGFCFGICDSNEYLFIFNVYHILNTNKSLLQSPIPRQHML